MRRRQTAGSRSPIVRIPYEEAYASGFEDMMRRVPSVEKLERTIGFKPSSTLEQIVQDVVAEQQAIFERDARPPAPEVIPAK